MKNEKDKGKTDILGASVLTVNDKKSVLSF